MEKIILKLQTEVKKLKEENKKLKSRKKYGIVWEEEKEPEQIVLDCKKKLPILRDIKDKEIFTDKHKPVNLLIEGDNYHSLQVLNYTHKGEIDVIYIDPPYNTGAIDWKYNNRYVGEDDSYRHSKWLNLMNNRLKIAKDLLKKDGIICVTIDDYELPTIWLLMNEIFGEENHLGTLVIRNNPKGRMTKRKVSLIHEYYLFFGASEKSQIKKLPEAMKNKTHSYKQDKNGEWYLPVNLRKQGVDSNAINRKGKLSHRYYPIYYDEKTGNVSTKEKYNIEILPIDSKGQKRIWRRSKDVIDKMFKEGKIWINKKRENYQVYFKFIGGAGEKLPQSIWINPKYSASDHGTKILNEILNKREAFDYPKSPFAIIDTIKICSKYKKAMSLDFFVGSGTTGEAVLRLNQEDSGERKFIICTNNENKICEEVTYPRINNVIKGYRFKGKDKKILYEISLTSSKISKFDEIKEEIELISEKEKLNFDKIETKIDNNTIYVYGINQIDGQKEGLGGNLKYYKTDFIDVANVQSVSDEKKIELTYQAGEIIAIREDAFEEVEKTKWWQIFKNSRKTVAIYFREDQEKLEELFEKLSKSKRAIIYLFSWGKNEIKGEEYGYNNITIKDIPQPIIEVYKEVNRL